MGLQLRQAMLVNGLLYSSEAWHSVDTKDIIALEKVDEALLRYLLDCPSKTPLEFLYLESGSIPIRYILKSRRLNFLKVIIDRDEEELTRRVFEAQATNPSPGDFAELVKDDLHSISVCMDMQEISNMGKEAFKNIVKQKVKKAAHHYLVEKKAKHSKVRNLEYINFETQPYLISPLFNDKETSMLAALRSRTHSSFKVNFRHLYGGMVDCPLKCWSPNEIHPEDSQEHLLLCRILFEKFTTE